MSALYGPDHPKTWAAANSLSGTLIAQGKYEEAESLVSDVLERATNVLGPEHTRTLNAMGNYALILQHQGRIDEAEALFRTIIEVSEKISGPEHPRVVRARSDLAVLLDEAGRIRRSGGRTLRRSGMNPAESRRPDPTDSKPTSPRVLSGQFSNPLST